MDINDLGMYCVDVLYCEEMRLCIDCKQWYWSVVCLLGYGVQDWGLGVWAWIVWSSAVQSSGNYTVTVSCARTK